MERSEILFFIRFSRLQIFHVNSITLKKNYFDVKCNMQKKNFFFCVQNFNLFKNCKNLHERSGIGWIERKKKFQIFPIFFSSYGHFVTSSPQFLMKFRNNSKNKEHRIFFFIFPTLFNIFHMFHGVFKVWPLLTGEEWILQISLIGKK